MIGRSAAPSLARTLLRWLLGALGLGGLLVVLTTYLVALDEINLVFDAELRNVAEAITAYHHEWVPADGSPARRRSPLGGEPTQIVTATWTRDGLLVHTSDPRVVLPLERVEGLSRPTVRGEAWVVWTDESAQGFTQAGQRATARERLAAKSAARIVPPLLVLALLVAALLVAALRRGLLPLDEASVALAGRNAESLEPIETVALPAEVRPFAESINALIGRLSSALAGQRLFLADAAHELRTPVTALRLQLQVLRGSVDDDEREESMRELAAGIERAQHLVEQLLHVARSGPDGEALKLERLDLAALVRQVVGTLSIKAEAAGIDLGAQADARVPVDADRQQMTVLLNNLVVNAVRYTQAGGQVDVVAEAVGGQALLRVVDDGPGIPVAERGRVFDRFYRGQHALASSHAALGTGLGLAIVQAIAQRHGATVELRTPTGGQGLEVVVSLPLAAAPT